MMTLCILIFIFSGGMIIYHHFGYPFLLAFASKYSSIKPKPQYSEDRLDKQKLSHLPSDALPHIALVIPVYNEGNAIAEKLFNLAFLEYPAEKLTIHVIFDGCNDNSYECAQTALNNPLCRSLQVTLYHESKNRGKLAQLNRLIPNIKADIIGLSDVTALLSIDALLLSAQHFSNKEIGAVCATYRFLSDGRAQETSYWQYQTQIKMHESALGSTLGAHGAFYLLRHSTFHTLPSDSINDDFLLPCEVIKQDYRVIYDPNMVAVEAEPTDLAQDFKRRVRISAGNLQQSLRLTSLLHPKHGITAMMFLSCKWVRPFMPLFFALALISSFFLSLHSVWLAPLFLGQISLYFLVLAQQLLKSNNTILIKLHYLVSGHGISVIGAFKYLTGAYKGPWR